MARSSAFRPSRLLVQIDPAASQQPALLRALRLAAVRRVQMRLVAWVPAIPSVVPQSEAVRRMVEAQARDALTRAVAHVRRGASASATAGVLQGDEATAMVQEASRWRADLVLRSHNLDRTMPHPAGPVDSQILRRCPVPVWLVTKRQADGERVIVAAVDPEPTDPVRHQLALQVVRAAVTLAAESGATLHVVHAWTAYGHQVLASRASRKDLLAYYAACHEQAERRFAALRREAALPDAVHCHLIEGDPHRLLMQKVPQWRTSLLVLGTVGRTGLAGLVIGNTAERILREVTCSVLALKPAGFAAAATEVKTPAR